MLGFTVTVLFTELFLVVGNTDLLASPLLILVFDCKLCGLALLYFISDLLDLLDLSDLSDLSDLLDLLDLSDL